MQGSRDRSEASTFRLRTGDDHDCDQIAQKFLLGLDRDWIPGLQIGRGHVLVATLDVRFPVDRKFNLIAFFRVDGDLFLGRAVYFAGEMRQGKICLQQQPEANHHGSRKVHGLFDDVHPVLPVTQGLCVFTRI